ncbi:MAG: glycosyltransferase family 39 protein [bacterium]|nr:glycosyltransferase family 39 protein [bacterium]
MKDESAVWPGNQDTQPAATPLWVIMVITAAGLCLRVPLLDYSFYGDEGFSLLRDSASLITNTEDRFRPLFFSLLYMAAVGLHGRDWAAAASLLFGAAQIPLAFLVGRKLRDDTLGVVLAVLVAVSPMLIEFSQELRMYSLVAMLALVQAYSLLRLIDRFTWPQWILFVVVALAGVYSHLLYWFLLAGLAVTFLRVRSAIPLWKGWGALAATALLYLPNFPNLLRFQGTRGAEYAMDFASALPKLFAAFSVGFSYFVLPEQGAGRAISVSDIIANLPLALLAMTAGAVILWKTIWLHGRERDRRVLWFAHELFTVPVALATLACLVTGKYFLQPKYLIFSAPFALLFIALAFDDLRNVRAKQVIAGLGALIAMLSLTHYWQPDKYGRKENWRTAAEIMSTTIGDTNALVLLPGPYRLLRYYAPGIESSWDQVDVVGNETAARSRLHELASTKQYVYYIRHDVVQNTGDPDDLLIQYLDQSGRPHTVTQLNPRFKLHRWG